MDHSLLTHLLLLLSLAVGAWAQGTNPKKGVGVSTKEYMCDDYQVLKDFSWYHDWRLTLGILKEHTINCPKMPTLEYVPMNYKYVEDGWLGYAFYTRDEHYMMLYYSPMRYSQGNMTPQIAAAKWKSEKDQVGPDTKIITPTASVCKTRNKNCMMSDFDWFDQFFESCSSEECRFDYMAVQHFSCVAQYTLNYLRKLHNRYGYDIWLIEFACTSDDEQVVKDYMTELIPQLNELSYVHRYAWSKARHTSKPKASLFQVDSSTLTELGELYLSL